VVGPSASQGLAEKGAGREPTSLPFLVFIVAGTEGAAGGSWDGRITRFTRATGATRDLHQGEHGYLKPSSVVLYHRKRRPSIV